MAESVDPWARVAEVFVVDHYSSLHGVVRSRLIAAHLAEHLPGPPGRVIDIGGGAGTQSIPLARLGYDVVILDSSPAMLERAEAALADAEPDVATRVELVEAAGEDALDHVEPGTFTAALCHGVLMYLDDPRPMVATLCQLAAKGGVVSIVAKHRATLALRPGMEGRWADALAAFDAAGEVNRLGFETRADDIEELSAMVAGAGADPVGWYGVRMFSEPWNRFEPGSYDLDEVVAVELEASRRDPYRWFSRLFHLVARKRR